MRGLAFFGAVLLLAGPALADEPPAALAPYVEDGALRAGDYGWARGAFKGAGPQDKAAYESIVAWRDACFAAARDDMRAEVAALGGVLPDDDIPYGGPQLCRTAFPPKLEAFPDFAQLEAASARVTPLFASYMAAADRAQSISTANATTLGEQLLARTLVDQLLRGALVLVWTREPPFAGLSDAEIAVLDALVRNAVMAQDLVHTEWLKAHVAEHGWPTVSEAGPRGANAAWLLAQHADLDPAFQLRALQLMEPQVVAGEANAANFAALTDRVWLKLSGLQRYGTQLSCRDGWREALMLEDAAGVDARRAEMGMSPLADYVATMNARGPCSQG